MRISIYAFFSFLGLILFNQCQEPLTKQMPTIVSLNDCNWKFAEKDSTNYLPATVPGSVHMDLLNNDIISDPYYRDNEKDLQWIGERDWVYNTTFKVEDALLANQVINLCFDGLDTYAHVFVNGAKVLSANNYFREWQADVKPHLVAGDNSLEIQFNNAVSVNTQMRSKDSIPLFDDYVYSRKPAFHFGWDWGPIYITSGIWRPVYIQAWSNTRITNQQFTQPLVSKELAKIKLKVEIESVKELVTQLNVSCSEAGINQTIPAKLKKGLNEVELNFDIENPKLWWSHGLGEPHLYEFETKLIDGTNIYDHQRQKIGVREIKLMQIPDESGASFHFELNGVPVFAKGANYIPQESFQSKVDSADYRQVIRHAVDANMNMLRVWGGGFYEEDYFYDLCDENGLLVWQDFMFACSMYPGEENYLENVRQEAIENVKRLRNHACLALWCGNNENYIGWRDWRWPSKFKQEDSASVWNDYLTLFEELLPQVIDEYDTGKDYWPSSPKYGWGYPVNIDGDSHLWAVWHAQDPFEVFLEEENIPRFMSEYGFQSLPEMKTIEAFTLPEDRSIDSDVMKAHQKHRVGYPVIDKYIKRDYNWPKDFESYVYVSQVLQAKGIKMGIEAHRRAMPFCMGTLYWQINDCWPVASWSSVDYYNRWKALHYRVRDAYAKELISAVIKDDDVEIYTITDLLEDKERTIKLRLLQLDGKELWNDLIEIVVPANTSTKILSKSLTSIVGNTDLSDIVLDVQLLDGENIISRNPLYFVPPKDLNLTRGTLIQSIKEIGENELAIVLESDVLVKNLFLSFDGVDGHFSDNYFDVLPGEKYTIYFKANEKGDVRASGLSLIAKSLIDSYL